MDSVEKKPGASQRTRGGSSAKRFSIALALALTAIATLMCATPAFAASQSHCSGASGIVGCSVNMADNLTHTWNTQSLASYDSSAVTWTTNYLNSDTGVVAQHDTTLDSNTDVVCYDDNYSTASSPPCAGNSSWYPKGRYFGYTACSSLTSWNGCQQHRVWFDTPWSSTATYQELRALALNETGHSLGLKHPAENSTSGDVANEVMSYDLEYVNYYSSRDKSLINTFSRSAQ